MPENFYSTKQFGIRRDHRGYSVWKMYVKRILTCQLYCIGKCLLEHHMEKEMNATSGSVQRSVRLISDACREHRDQSWWLQCYGSVVLDKL